VFTVSTPPCSSPHMLLQYTDSVTQTVRTLWTERERDAVAMRYVHMGE
jgi:hypothetical protein